ncbi:hypothetical protein [Conexibacter sp. SYSU D00693]|uniref:hypothetical protein n=1 Tax=Conexibacter sp. SYSU D00693 TaxID=2812560 RepID=UPI00196A3E55|nr:hypothetical protein [Conexibacter sp. SYSU D00693]
MSAFGFVQVELPYVLGPQDGRYVVRGHAGEAEHVLVLATLGAPQRRLLRGKKPATAAAGAPVEPVSTARATVIDARPVEGEAEAWLAKQDLDDRAEEGIAVLNDVLQAHRIAAADPFVREVSREQAIVVRVGAGVGDDVAHGRWSVAKELPRAAPRKLARRTAALRPQERLAALLGGRDVALACEELVLRARLDVDRGRHREAALQLRVALEAAIAELEPWASTTDLSARLAELREGRGAVGAAANMALQGGLDEATILEVERLVGRTEAALRARTAPGIA